MIMQVTLVVGGVVRNAEEWLQSMGRGKGAADVKSEAEKKQGVVKIKTHYAPAPSLEVEQKSRMEFGGGGGIDRR